MADGKGTLYIVATPIGNLEDISLRALKILKSVHRIAAEDTRHTKKLLNAYQISVPLTSLYEHNELKKSGALIKEVLSGHDLAYVSDAGTPGISDPGYLLVQEALSHDIPVLAIPGPCAAVTALSISGLPTDSFVFYGFLPAKPGKRLHFLEALADEKKTMIFYESPKRLMGTLKDMVTVLGDRQAVVTRELTKMYEETARDRISGIIAKWQDREVKGEITLLVAGREESGREYSDQDIQDLLRRFAGQGELSERDCIDKIAGEYKLPRKRVYRIAMQAKRE